MIAHLKGTVHRLSPGKVAIDVHGVGYAVGVPLSVWEKLAENQEVVLQICSYVREDRFDLFGFFDESNKTLFEHLIAMPGIGPSLALEICAVPVSILLHAIHQNDSDTLTSIKGIGKKRAEKLLIELRSIVEKMPHLFQGDETNIPSAMHDRDAIEALKALGYDAATAMHALKRIAPNLPSTEERVAAALRSL